jgi:hypothetical protein
MRLTRFHWPRGGARDVDMTRRLMRSCRENRSFVVSGVVRNVHNACRKSSSTLQVCDQVITTFVQRRLSIEKRIVQHRPSW